MLSKTSKIQKPTLHNYHKPTKKSTYNNPSNTNSELLSSEKTPLKLYLKGISQYPLLTIQEEIDLAKKIKKGNAAARLRMINSNLRLVVKIAQDYNHFGLPLMDLISEGNIGLIKAVERFNPQKGSKLSTYAAWWIKQSIKRALANQSKTIRLPVHLVEKISNMKKTATFLQEKLKREPTNEEIAKTLSLPTEHVAHLLSVSIQPASLDSSIGEDQSNTLGDVIGDENTPTPSEKFHDLYTIKDIQNIVKSLDERESKIISMRFGLFDQPVKTLEEIGSKLNLTRERVRQLQNSILKQLRNRFIENERSNSVEEIKERRLTAARMKVLKDFHEDVVKKKLNNRFIKTQKKNSKLSFTSTKKQRKQAKKP